MKMFVLGVLLWRRPVMEIRVITPEGEEKEGAINKSGRGWDVWLGESLFRRHVANIHTVIKLLKEAGYKVYFSTRQTDVIMDADTKVEELVDSPSSDLGLTDGSNPSLCASHTYEKIQDFEQ